MFKLSGNQVVRTFNQGKFLLQKNSPAILMGLGVVGVVASTVLACKATLKLDEVKYVADENIEHVHQGREKYDEEVYSQESYQRDLAVVHVQKVVSIAKLYAPSVLLGAASIGCILGSHYILNKRNVGLMAAYAILNDSFKKYRGRVVDEFGAQKDFAFHNDIKETTVTETVINEDGTKTKTKKTVLLLEDNQPSGYARFFDESSVQWRKDYTHNLFFLKAQQNYANDLLKMQGHVFLNEVYDMLSLPRSSAGALVGWVYEGDNIGDNYIDFGIYAPENVDAVNGYAKKFLLDFNVDGVIYDAI